jgi:P-type E1-E2 ATPase
VKGWLDGVAILIAVVLIVSVTAGNNYMKDQQFRRLNAIASNREVNVIRDGKVSSLNVFDLAVGDIVKVVTGEILPVDGILIKSNNISTDESSITGETNLLKKEVP